MSVSRAMYQYLAKPLFFARDPETVHDFVVKTGHWLGGSALARAGLRAVFAYRHPSLRTEVCGINFDNPIGLAAGFDKDAQLTAVLPAVGFGFAEIGSVTGLPCAGNPKPRLWRLPESDGLVVYYGLKNNGCEEIAARLRRQNFRIPIGTSVAMTNCPANLDSDRAVADYAYAFRVMNEIGAYTTVNISCPNTSGGQPFIEPENLDKLFRRLDQIATTKPIFVKLSPDLTNAQLDKIVAVLCHHRVQGIICTNLTKRRDNAAIKEKVVPAKGGISGRPVLERSEETLAYLYRQYGRQFAFIGCGGVFSALDAYRKIRLGASLVQLITGMIFEGPQLIGEINRGLVTLLARDGFHHIAEAVGVDSRSSSA